MGWCPAPGARAPALAALLSGPRDQKSLRTIQHKASKRPVGRAGGQSGCGSEGSSHPRASRLFAAPRRRFLRFRAQMRSEQAADRPGGGRGGGSYSHLVDRLSQPSTGSSAPQIWLGAPWRLSIASRAVAHDAQPPPAARASRPCRHARAEQRPPPLHTFPTSPGPPSLPAPTTPHQPPTWTPCPRAAQPAPAAPRGAAPMRRRRRRPAPCSLSTPPPPAQTSLTTSCWPSPTRPASPPTSWTGGTTCCATGAGAGLPRLAGLKLGRPWFPVGWFWVGARCVPNQPRIAGADSLCECR